MPSSLNRLIAPARRVAMIALALALPVASLSAQLPTVQQVYDKFATAMGGRAAWAKVTDRAEIGTANITFANLSGSYERYYSAPNKFRLVIDLGVAKVEQGTDGKVAWGIQPGAGAAKLPAEDAAYVIEASATGDAFLDPTRFAKSAVTAKEVYDGVECYKVELSMKSGRSRIDYFEVSTGLRRAQVLMTSAGEQRTAFHDYKAFDGKMAPTKVVQSNAQGDVIITINTVTFTTNDPKLFALPEGITP
jgi:hypothetical protein